MSKKLFIDNLKKLVTYNISFKKDYVEKTLKLPSTELKKEIKLLDNIIKYKDKGYGGFNSLCRDFLAHSNLTNEEISSLTISYSVTIKEKNTKDYQKYLIFKIEQKGNTKPPIFYLLIPTLNNKRLHYSSYIHHNGISSVVWGDGNNKDKIESGDYNANLLRNYLTK